jgi:uncharacterized membrane protein required for colicin V production
MEFLKSLNWVDILVVALAVRILYSGFKTGFVIEFMKTLAAFFALFAAFHYYVKISSMFGRFVGLTQPILEVIVFAAIWLVVVTAMKFLRDGLFLVFTVQTISIVDRWGAMVISAGRFFLTTSMVLFVFLLTDKPYMERMTSSSFAQKYVLSVAPDMYKKTVNGFVVKFFPNEKVNPAVTEELNETGKK